MALAINELVAALSASPDPATVALPPPSVAIDAGLYASIFVSDDDAAEGDPDAQPIVRDWTIYLDIAARLRATKAYNEVGISDAAEARGFKAQSHAIAIVVPGKGDESSYLDDPGQDQWERVVTWTLLIYSKGKTPLERDSEAERLGNVARIALDYQCLAGATVDGKTKIVGDSYDAADPPYRLLRLSGTFAYFINGPAGRSAARIW